MQPKKITEIFKRLKADRPAPRSELVFKTPYELLVAVMLSAQATDASVNKATEKLFPAANTPEAIAAMGVETLKGYIKTINLYPTKARNIVRMSEILLERFGGQVPDNRDDLVSLPGVGRKTANVVLNTAFNQDVIAVDTHIFRVANRTGIAPGKDVLAVEKKLLEVVPKAYLKDAHHWLLLHGRYTCKARSFNCQTCPINDLCEFPGKTS